MPALKQRALRAAIWSGLDVLLRRGLGFGISIALARLIAPAQFGIIALLYLFTGLANTFVDSGFSYALIQKRQTSPADESTVFWFNVLLGALMTATLCAIAPLLARFFAQPVLVPITLLVAPTILISSLGSIHLTLLARALDFRTQMKIGTISTLVSGAGAIALGWMDYGVWALAWQQMLATVCTTAMLWRWHHWRPRLEFSSASARELFGFGGYLMGSSLLTAAFTNAYTLLIGRFFGVLELGYYNRAYATQQVPTGALTSILSRVAFPIYSAAGSDKSTLQRGVRLSVRSMMLINVPMMLGLAAVAPSMVATLFGERWLPAVPILQVLCLAGVLWPLHAINMDALTAQGYSRLVFRLDMIKSALGLVLLVAGMPFGVLGIAWSFVLFSIAAFFINAHYTDAFIDYGAAKQLRDIAPTLAISVAMAVLVLTLDATWRPPPAFALAAGVALGVVFTATAASLFHLDAMSEVLGLLRGASSLRHPIER